MAVSKKESSPCPIDAFLSVIDGRWKGTILWRLMDGPKRTSELRRSIPEMTERMLIRHLQELVQGGILCRHDQKTIPPCVYYSISKYGETMIPVLEQMCAWGRIHLARTEAPDEARKKKPRITAPPVAGESGATRPLQSRG